MRAGKRAGKGPGEAAGNGRRRQADRRAESDRRMLRAAFPLIAAHGSKGVSMAQIGTAAGFSRGLPAERFGTKLRLLEAVVEATEAWFARRLVHILAGKSGCEALAARIVAHLESVRDSSEAAIALYQLVVEAMGSVPELRPRITQLNSNYCAGMMIHLREAQAAGELRDGVDLEQHAMAIVSAMHGTAIQAIIDGGAADLGERARYVAEIHVAAVRRPKGE